MFKEIEFSQTTEWKIETIPEDEKTPSISGEVISLAIEDNGNPYVRFGTAEPINRVCIYISGPTSIGWIDLPKKDIIKIISALLESSDISQHDLVNIISEARVKS